MPSRSDDPCDDILRAEGEYDQTVVEGRGAPPCQEPDCERDSVALTDWTYCPQHGAGEGASMSSEGPGDE